MRSVVLVLSAALVTSGSVAHGERHDAEPNDRALARWIDAATEMRETAELAASWTRRAAPDLDVPDGDAIARITAMLHVQVRRAVAAGEHWLATLAGELGAGLAVPDLTVLVADPVKGIESSGFGWRRDPFRGHRKFHKGTDYRADRGTPVYAAGPGVVAFAGRQSGYGKVVYLDHGAGLVTRYAHLRAIDVREGDAVPADAKIGEVGSTGRTTGPHLHFEVRIDGRAVDPVMAMHVATMQRTQPAPIARLAAMALLPEIQAEAVSAKDPPRRTASTKKKSTKPGNRPDRPGRVRRPKPVS